MNTTPGNEPTDEQLDAMLRDVQIPSELKPRLKRIPSSATATEQDRFLQTTLPAPNASRSTSWLTYALAACLLAVATFAATRFLSGKNDVAMPNKPNPTTTAEVRDPVTQRESVSKDPMIAKSNSESHMQDQELQALQAAIQELEIAKLQSELSYLQQINSARLSQNEVESVIMALAPEHCTSLGGNESYVRSEMDRVQREYPDTRGAMLAEAILQEIN